MAKQVTRESSIAQAFRRGASWGRQDAGIIVGFVLSYTEVFKMLAEETDALIKTKAAISLRSGRNISETISVLGTNVTRRSGSPGSTREKRLPTSIFKLSKSNCIVRIAVSGILPCYNFTT